MDNSSNSPLVFFDQQVDVETWDISYVAIGTSEASRFVNDSLFTIVYENDEIAIFKVNRHELK